MTTIDKLTMKDLVTLHNAMAPTAQVKRFENRAKATRRVTALLTSFHMTIDVALVQAQMRPAPPEARMVLPSAAAAVEAAPEASTEPTPEPDSSPMDAARSVSHAGQRVTRDRVVEDADGFYAIVNGTAYGCWRSRAEAQGGLQVEQERARLKGHATTTVRAPKRATGPTATQQKIIDLCGRPHGATAKEMCDAIGWPSIAARSVCSSLAARYGYELQEAPKRGDRGIAFRLTSPTA